MATILIVDDAAFMRKRLRHILTDAGHDVIGEAANGLEAVERFDSLEPDLVTLDVTMPELDGLSALRRIVTKHPEARVVMCSAMGQKQVMTDAVEAGAVDFILKPFDEVRVSIAIQRALR